MGHRSTVGQISGSGRAGGVLSFAMVLSIGLASTVVKRAAKVWTVRWEPGDPTFEAIDADTSFARVKCHLRCTASTSGDAVYHVHTIESMKVRTSSERVEPLSHWTLEQIERVVIKGNAGWRVDVEAPSDQWTMALGKIGLTSLLKAVHDDYRRRAKNEPEFFEAPPRLLARRGPRGLPETVYALWAERYVNATAEYGRGFMKHLLEDYPGETRSNILRRVSRAEQLGLLRRTHEPGKVGQGELTAKAIELLSYRAVLQSFLTESADEQKGNQ